MDSPSGYTTHDATKLFFEQPILNSPYEYPDRHWELKDGIPTQHINETRRPADFVTPIPKPKKYAHKPSADADTSAPEAQKSPPQRELVTAQGDLLQYSDKTHAAAAALSDNTQQYHIALINEIRHHVNAWRNLPEKEWNVTSVTKRLLKHWRTYPFNSIRPFFCQREAVETAIWLAEVARRQKLKKQLEILAYLDTVNATDNAGLPRIALKLATGAGKTTVMAMLIAWQTLNAVRFPQSDYFTKGFLIVAPGITIRDRLRVLNPNDPESYYQSRELVPQDMLLDLQQARIVITNYHALKRREKLDIAKGTRAALEGWRGKTLPTLETEGEMLQRVMPDLLRLERVLVFNDEAHHCYREKALPPQGAAAPAKLSAEEKKEAEANRETARVWISGLESLAKKKKIIKVFDLSATPFYLSGSGYAESTIFPWTMSDFSLMDAIECGIVKLPRVPVSGNIPEQKMPMFRNLWQHIKKDMPKPKDGKPGDPLSLPAALLTALDALYGHYQQVFADWQANNMPVPPCFVIVCNNTLSSKLVYDFISGFSQTLEDGSKQLHNGRYALFRNFDENGDPYPRPRTLLIDSQQLDRDDALDAHFTAAARAEIEQFKRDIVRRGDSPLAQQARNGTLPDAVLLREVMNTVGKQGKLGETIRCVVSVSMLTEGWDANTVTHILGVRAFGTQLLCEQVIGRALRRYGYDLDKETQHFATEYADILGIPFIFADRPVKKTPVQQREMVHVQAMIPERDPCEIVFPRVAGYRVELPSENLKAAFTKDSRLCLTPDLVGETEVQNAGIIGESLDLTLKHLKSVRDNRIKMELTKHLLIHKFRDSNGEVKVYLFGQLWKLVSDWFESSLECRGGTYPAQLLYLTLADRACEKIVDAVTRAHQDSRPIRALLHPYNPSDSTRYVHFNTSETRRYRTDPRKSHLNWHVCDSDWELEFCRVAEKHPRVHSYVKNRALGFEVPYTLAGEPHVYVPDFIVTVDDGHGKDDLLHVVAEIKGYRNEAAAAKKETMETYWIPGVNRLKDYGRWAFVELQEIYRLEQDFNQNVDAAFDRMITNAVEASHARNVDRG